MLTRRAVLAVPLLAPFLGGAAETPPMRYIYHRDSATRETRNTHFWRLLQAVLDRTSEKFGPYELAASATIDSDRRIYGLSHPSPDLTVSVFTARTDMAGKAIPVRIPLDRGLLGYRILLIRSGDQARFDQVRRIEDLRNFTFGLGQAWDDVEIMRAAKIPVVVSGSFDGLFRMLGAGRFDAFSRGASEILDENDKQRDAVPNLAIEKGLMLHYPLPVYYWFADSEEGRQLADRVRTGLEAMLADGGFEALFREYYGPQIAALDLDRRRVIELTNPLLGPNEPFDDARLWYRPAMPKGKT